MNHYYCQMMTHLRRTNEVHVVFFFGEHVVGVVATLVTAAALTTKSPVLAGPSTFGTLLSLQPMSN